MDIENFEKSKHFISEHFNDDLSTLALSARKYPEINIPFVISQIKAQKAIQYKIPGWYNNPDIIYPVQLSIEQSSSELTATFKTTLLQGDSLTDLTGGFGVDCAFLSTRFKKITYVERNAELCDIARHNFKALGLDIEIINANTDEYASAMQAVDCIYIDPARRDSKGNKIVTFADCEPNVTELLPTLFEKADTILIKASPMLDISKALGELQHVAEIYIVSVDNECKELLFLLKKGHLQEPVVTAVLLHKDRTVQTFSFTFGEEKTAGCRYAEKPEKYLYEPNVALLKAGAYKLLSEKLNIKKLHPNSHLYTSETLLTDFPGRIFKTENFFSFQKQELKQQLGNIHQANITVRNFPETVDGLRKKLKLSDGGDIYLFATTLYHGKKILIKTQKATIQ